MNTVIMLFGLIILPVYEHRNSNKLRTNGFDIFWPWTLRHKEKPLRLFNIPDRESPLVSTDALRTKEASGETFYSNIKLFNKC